MTLEYGDMMEKIVGTPFEVYRLSTGCKQGCSAGQTDGHAGGGLRRRPHQESVPDELAELSKPAEGVSN